VTLGSPAGAAVLVVEDDVATRREVAAFLRGHGFKVIEAGDAAAAWDRWAAQRPDLVVLDLGLPDTDGSLLIRRLRRDATTPILVLSARDREAEKVAALESGADDYVTKPFGAAELLARVRAVLRRAAGPAAEPTGEVLVGDLRMDVARHEVTVSGQPVRLTPREFEVLKVLLGSAGRLVTHGRLLRAVWGTAYSDEAHYLHVYVSQIRRKIAAADPTGGLAGLIMAEPGVGYRVRLPDTDRS
jgi:two-component system KDP operon response regulator KdpE